MPTRPQNISAYVLGSGTLVGGGASKEELSVSAQYVRAAGSKGAAELDRQLLIQISRLCVSIHGNAVRIKAVHSARKGSAKRLVRPTFVRSKRTSKFATAILADGGARLYDGRPAIEQRATRRAVKAERVDASACGPDDGPAVGEEVSVTRETYRKFIGE